MAGLCVAAVFHHKKEAKLKHAINANAKISDKKHVNSPIGLLQYILGPNYFA